LSGNLSTIYFHIVGNLIALNYKHDYTLYSGADSSAPSTAQTLPDSAFFTPLSPLKNEFLSPYTDAQIAKLRYDLSFVRSGNNAGTFSVAFNASDIKAAQAKGDTVKAGPSVINADFAHGRYRLGYQLKTPGGKLYVIDQFYR
jgi:hypothetical protein